MIQSLCFWGLKSPKHNGPDFTMTQNTMKKEEEEKKESKSLVVYFFLSFVKFNLFNLIREVLLCNAIFVDFSRSTDSLHGARSHTHTL